MTRPQTFHPLLGLLGWLFATFAAGAVGAWGSANAGAFYAQLAQPPWAPPAWLFGPVWSALFALMGVAVWLVWRRHGFAGARVALGLFVAHLFVNALWSWLFFAWQMGGAALADVLLLWLLVAALIRLFWGLHRVAAMLLLPYLAWVGFASVLNLVLWQRNPALLG